MQEVAVVLHIRGTAVREGGVPEVMVLRQAEPMAREVLRAQPDMEVV